MKNYLLILTLLIVGCGNRHSQQVATTQSIETGATDSTAEHVTEETDIEILPDSMNIVGGKSLNDIRFGNWTEKIGSTMIIFVLYARTLMRVTKGKLKMKF